MKAIEPLIEILREEYHVPAIRIGVVRGGETVYLGGSGLRDVENGLPADESTTFAIGSQTKSFVSTALALLADEGRLDFDRPIRDYLPEFAMEDGYLTETLSVRDMLSHRTGLARHEFMMQLNIDAFDAAEYVRRLRYLKAGAPVRAKMQYSNLMFTLAGYLLERVCGEKWDDFIRARFLEPLGMKRTNFSVAENQLLENRALPYCFEKDKIIRMPPEDIKAASPAGAMNSTVTDMLRYLRFHLEEGRAGESRLVSAARLRDCHSPHIVIPERAPIFRGEMQFQSYGLGWFAEFYRGHQVVRHGGGIDGFIAEMAMLPELDAGVVILSNLDGNFAPAIVQLTLIDMLLDREPADWAGRFREMRAAGKAQFQKHVESFNPAGRAARPSTGELAEYAGAYAHAGYGKIDFSLEGVELFFEARKLKVPLRPLGHGSFLLLDEEKFLAVPVQFGRDARGRVVHADADFEPATGAMIRYAKL